MSTKNKQATKDKAFTVTYKVPEGEPVKWMKVDPDYVQELMRIQVEQAQLKLDREKGNLVPKEQLTALQKRFGNLEREYSELKSIVHTIRTALDIKRHNRMDDNF